MNQESLQVQAYNTELEQDNARLVQELNSRLQREQIKDQKAETLQVQMEHQTEQFKELQQEFLEVIEQIQKREVMVSIKFSQDEVQEAAEYLMGQVNIEEHEKELKSSTNEMNEINEEQTVTGLLVKAAEKIRFLNKYIETIKAESDELSEKYDKLTLKLREIRL